MIRLAGLTSSPLRPRRRDPSFALQVQRWPPGMRTQSSVYERSCPWRRARPRSCHAFSERRSAHAYQDPGGGCCHGDGMRARTRDTRADRGAAEGGDGRRAAIASMVRAGFAAGSFTYAPKITSVEASDPIAIERGQNIVTLTPGPGAPADAVAYADTIMYITIWRKLDGQWLISKDIGTSDRPAT